MGIFCPTPSRGWVFLGKCVPDPPACQADGVQRLVRGSRRLGCRPAGKKGIQDLGNKVDSLEQHPDPHQFGRRGGFSVIPTKRILGILAHPRPASFLDGSLRRGSFALINDRGVRKRSESLLIVVGGMLSRTPHFACCRFIQRLP
jgi:hypothetical protein